MSLLLQLCLEINRGLWPVTAFWKIDILHDICQEWFWSDRYWLSVKEGQSFALNDKVHLLLNSTYTRPVACAELQISLAFFIFYYVLAFLGIVGRLRLFVVERGKVSEFPLSFYYKLGVSKVLFGGGSVKTNAPLPFCLMLSSLENHNLSKNKLYFERQKAEKMGKRNLLNESDKDL